MSKHTAAQLKQYQRLQQKLAALLAFDQALKPCPNTLIIGVDEVGRGSAIGPVVAAACCMPPQTLLPHITEQLVGLDDSKASHLNHPKRQALNHVITQHCMYATALASQAEVEQLNVAQASLLAARRAVVALVEQHQLQNTPLLVVMDGKQALGHFEGTLPGVQLSQQALVKGDAKSASIAAASILAKVHRDDWVLTVCEQHPHWQAYGWQNNMGYLTAQHQQGISELGLSPLHRRTFFVKQGKQLCLPVSTA